MTTQPDTLQESSSDKTTPGEETDLPSESTSGSLEPNPYRAPAEEQTRREREGVQRVLVHLEELTAEVESAERQTNFERRGSILRGMREAYNCAYRAVVQKFDLNTHKQDEAQNG